MTSIEILLAALVLFAGNAALFRNWPADWIPAFEPETGGRSWTWNQLSRIALHMRLRDRTIGLSVKLSPYEWVGWNVLATRRGCRF